MAIRKPSNGGFSVTVKHQGNKFYLGIVETESRARAVEQSFKNYLASTAKAGE